MTGPFNMTVNHTKIYYTLFYIALFRMASEFLPAKKTTLIEFDCVMSFSKMQLSQISNMNDNIIIKGFPLRTGFKAGTSLSFTVIFRK